MDQSMGAGDREWCLQRLGMTWQSVGGMPAEFLVAKGGHRDRGRRPRRPAERRG